MSKIFYYRYIGAGESYHLVPARDLSKAEMQGYLSRVSKPEKDAILRLYEKIEGDQPTIEQKVVDNSLSKQPADQPVETAEETPAPAEPEPPAEAAS